uniref:Uncharacterized protein n=1 Tax=Sphaerodactylus townsendi TaxID=933632 RepID=A0ACB8FZP9_9SAUR
MTRLDVIMAKAKGAPGCWLSLSIKTLVQGWFGTEERSRPRGSWANLEGCWAPAVALAGGPEVSGFRAGAWEMGRMRVQGRVTVPFRLGSCVEGCLPAMAGEALSSCTVDKM